MHKISENCILKKGYFSTFLLMLTNCFKKERKKMKEKKEVYQNVFGSLLHSFSSLPSVNDKGSFSMTVIHLPK